MNEEGRIEVVRYSADGATFSPETPRVWSPTPIRLFSAEMMDLHPDGLRFAVFPASETPAESGVHLGFLQNFFNEFHKKIESAGK